MFQSAARGDAVVSICKVCRGGGFFRRLREHGGVPAQERRATRVGKKPKVGAEAERQVRMSEAASGGGSCVYAKARKPPSVVLIAPVCMLLSSGKRKGRRKRM